MRTICLCSNVALLLSCLIIVTTCLDQHEIVTEGSRKALEVIIGGEGGASPTPPDSTDCRLPPPPPPPPESVCPLPPSPPPRPPPRQSPPPPPPRPPPRQSPPPQPPLIFESKRVQLVYPVIQRFKKRITHDPKGVTKTWNGPDVCHKYVGFYCDIVPDLKLKGLAGVDFSGFNLGGDGGLPLNDFVEQLPDLAIFHVNSNNFTGTVPAKISTLRYLYELDLSNNNFMGRFPTEVLSATKITFLDLRFNTFSGSVPPQVFNLKLDVLFINNNNLIQNLPDNLWSTTALYLTLANNRFTGNIPRSIGGASKTLIEVLLLNNQLSGCLPYEIGLLSSATLFDASQNRLTGPIPHSFSCLGKMEILNLAQNQLYGPVPETVCKLPNLGKLSLSYNYFTQVGPECRKLIQRNVLDVGMNCILDLPMQRSATHCAAFFSTLRTCPDERSLTYVPCSHDAQLNPQEASDDRSTAQGGPRRSYGSLKPHRL